MNNRSDIEKKVEDTLLSLEGLERATPENFFYTRLHARLQRQNKNLWEQLSYFISRPVIAFALSFAVITFNVVVLYQTRSSATSLSDQVENTLPEDYSLQILSFYEAENP